MYGSRVSSELIKGLQDFLRVADANKRNGFAVCPCSVASTEDFKRLITLDVREEHYFKRYLIHIPLDELF
jgi:hypothetical protein